MSVRFADSVTQVELDSTGCFEILRDPAEVDFLELRIHAPAAGEGLFRFDSVPATGELGALELTPVPLTRLQIEDEEGRAIEGARVTSITPAWFGEAIVGASARSDAEGRAELALSAGAEALVIRAAGFQAQRVPRDRLANDVALTVKLQAARSLTVQLVDADGPLQPGAFANLVLGFESEQGLLTRDAVLDQDVTPKIGSLLHSQLRERGMVKARVQPDANGRVVWSGVAGDGAVRLELRSLTGRLLASDTIQLSGAANQEHRLVIAETARRYSGVVVDESGRSVTGASVSLRALDREEGEGQWLRVATDLQGRFVFPALWADRYELHVSAPGFVVFQDRERTVLPGQEDRLTLQAGREVQITALDQKGERRAIVQVDARAENGRLFRTLPGAGEDAARLRGLTFEPLELELLVDGWVYRARVDAQQEELTFMLPERFVLPQPANGWAVTSMPEGLPPAVLLRKHGESTGQALLLVPHPREVGRWVLPTEVLLPRGTWTMQAPDGEQSVIGY